MDLLLKIILVAFIGIVGLLPCIYMVISMPAVIIWKIYRKFKYHLSIWD